MDRKQQQSKGDQSWSRSATVYHVYPRSFQDTTNNGVGDLQGIIDRLDYLQDGTDQSLGIRALWLSPVYKSPMKDMGYDIADFSDIDPLFGDLDTFDELVTQCHGRDIKLIMDFVANHTSDQHPWFQESRLSRDNPKRDWYIWHDPKPDGSPPNNWLSVAGGSGWTLDEQTGQYYFHSFLPEQPDLNWRNKQVQDAMLDVLRFWIDRGVDGFRADAAHHLMKDKQFRDDPPNPDYNPATDNPYDKHLHIHSKMQPETLDQTKAFCSILNAGGNDGYILSEAYIDLPEMQQFYAACDHGEHAPLNFHLLSLPWDASEYRNFVDKFEASLGPKDWPNYVLGNHDNPRVASRLGQSRARAAAMMIFTLRGMPFVYYGEELGMEDGEIPPDKQHDTFAQSPIRQTRDVARTPMQWSDQQYAGFSTVEPWLPVSDDYQQRNVAVQSSHQTSCLNLYRRLIHLRDQLPALLAGQYTAVRYDNDHIFSYRRVCDEQQLEVCINFSQSEQQVALDHPVNSVLCSTYMDAKITDRVVNGSMTLRPHEGILFDVTGNSEED